MRNLTLIYILALTVIALVISASQYLVQRSIAISRYDSRTINISGRQSMLSQKLTKAALAMETAENEEDFESKKTELREAAALWELSHNALQYGNAALDLADVNNSEKTLLLFLEVEPHFTAMESALDKIVQLNYGDSTSIELLRSNVDVVVQNEDDFLRIMNEITLDYDNESSTRLVSLSSTEYVLFGIALLLLILEGLLIFRPAINQINAHTHQLEEHERTLELALNETQKEKEKVDFLNLQAKSVFENVKQGIFLLDKDFTISQLYSKEMEVLFDSKNLGGSNFLTLMRPRLVQRDREALDMFVKHLFNKDIEEEVLQKLNPIDKVQIYFTNKDSSLEARYVSVSFSRIQDQRTIRNVLVTIADETEAVQMQKKISETEERNKRESAQLLSILRVDPNLLKEFLERANTDLKGISSLYESDKSMDFLQLISTTFNTIHNLKGNASLVDLQLVVDRLHEIETIITPLRDKPDLKGNDFLKILYEINDLISIIGNMERMLGRIAEVNQKMIDGARLDTSNAKLIQILDNGFRKMSKELSKSAKLKIEDNGILIPKKLHLAVRDIGIQLLKNSLTHGIEDPALRESKGKNPQGVIEMTFDQRVDGTLILDYQDDGRGLDPEKIADHALKNNLVSEVDLLGMSDSEKYKLIFMDGFSTATSVSQFAGRGQGMSIISEIVNKHNGTLAVKNTMKGGFGITLTLSKIKEKNEANDEPSKRAEKLS